MPGAASSARLDEPLRVALVFGTYPPERNGGSDFIARFAAALVTAGAHVSVLTSPADAPEHETEPSGVEVHRVIDDWTLGAEGRLALRRANDVLREEDSRILHVFFPDSVLQARYQLPALLGAGRLPLVTTFWSLGLGPRSPRPIRMQALGLLARSRAVLTHDPTYLRALRATVGRLRPVHWLPVGNNLAAGPVSGGREAARRRLGLGTDVPYLGYFGQLDETRGVEDLFGALKLLREERDVRLLMIGAAGREERYAQQDSSLTYYRGVRALPVDLGLVEAVLWTDYLPDADVVRMLTAVDLCVLPYRRNSLGRSALARALELGVPTVLGGTARSVAPLRPGEHVALHRPGDHAGLAATILELLEDDELRSRLAAGARRASRLFAWPRIAASAEGVYRRALADGK